MKNVIWIVLVFVAFSCSNEKLVFETDVLKISFDAQGNVCSLIDIGSGKEYHPQKQKSPLLTLYENDTIIVKPKSMAYNEEQSLLILKYPNGSMAKIKFDNKKQIFSF